MATLTAQQKARAELSKYVHDCHARSRFDHVRDLRSIGIPQSSMPHSAASTGACDEVMTTAMQYACPKCKTRRYPERVIISRGHSARRWELPYLMCGQCRLIGIDIALARRTLRRLVQETQVTSSSSSLTEEMLSRLDDHVAYYCRDVGYTRAHFRRVRIKTP